MAEKLKKIASFTIDHDVLTSGLYLSRVDGDCRTYDLRMRTPNAGDYLPLGALHTLEHLLATFLRSGPRSDEVVYVGPMGCRTGFYVILRDSVSAGDAIALLRDAFAFAADFQGPVPGARRVECGNYRAHDLPGARREAAAYLEVLRRCTPQTMEYPKRETPDGTGT